MLTRAKLKRKNGRNLLILGLHDPNIKQLVDDGDIYLNLSAEKIPELEAWDVVLLGPEAAACVAGLGEDEMKQLWP